MTTPAETSTSAAAEGPVPSWQGFTAGVWMTAIDVRDFIQANYQPYDGDERFLAPATTRTQELWGRLEALFVEERRKGVLDVSQVPSSITAHAPGYIDREREIIVGLQTDAPLKRAIMPNGGFRLVVDALKAYTAEMTAVPQLAPSHRAARRVRPWPHHRRLSPRRALRRDAAHRAKARRKERPRPARPRPTKSSVTVKSCPSRFVRSRSCRSWRAATASTSPVRPIPRKRPCSGCTSAISPASRSRTAPPCRWDAPPRSSTSTSNATSRRGF